MGSRGQQVARLVVIGGGAAGMSAASAARRVAPALDAIVCEAGGFAAYGMCGVPDFLGGTVAGAGSPLAYTPAGVRGERGIDPRPPPPGHRVDPGGGRGPASGARRGGTRRRVAPGV